MDPASETLRMHLETDDEAGWRARKHSTSVREKRGEKSNGRFERHG